MGKCGSSLCTAAASLKLNQGFSWNRVSTHRFPRQSAQRGANGLCMHELSLICKRDVRTAHADRQISSMAVDKATIQTSKLSNHRTAFTHLSMKLSFGFFRASVGEVSHFQAVHPV